MKFTQNTHSFNWHLKVPIHFAQFQSKKTVKEDRIDVMTRNRCLKIAELNMIAKTPRKLVGKCNFARAPSIFSSQPSQICCKQKVETFLLPKLDQKGLAQSMIRIPKTFDSMTSLLHILADIPFGINQRTSTMKYFEVWWSVILCKKEKKCLLLLIFYAENNYNFHKLFFHWTITF